MNELPNITKEPNCRNAAHNIREDLFGENCEQCGIITAYADDITMHISNTLRTKNQSDMTRKIEIIERFLHLNGLTVNRGKTKIMESMVRQKRSKLGGEGPKLKVTENNGQTKILEGEKTCKLLGGIIQDDLSWRGHLLDTKDSLVPTLNKRLGCLKYVGKNIGKKGKLLLTNGFFISKLLYLIGIWGGTNQTTIDIIQRVQNDAARFVTGQSRRTKKWTLMEECKWLDIRELIVFHTTLHMWKIVWKKAPLHLHTKIHIDQEHKLYTDSPRLQTTSTSLRHRGVNIWNQLPSEMRGNANLPRFKKSLKTWILARRYEELGPRAPDEQPANN